MKKIKNIRQLRAEKQRMKQQQEFLETKIRTNWKDVKESLRPVNLAKDAIGSIFKNKTAETTNGDNILKNSFTYGISLLAKRFAEKAGERLGKAFKK